MVPGGMFASGGAGIWGTRHRWLGDGRRGTAGTARAGQEQAAQGQAGRVRAGLDTGGNWHGRFRNRRKRNRRLRDGRDGYGRLRNGRDGYGRLGDRRGTGTPSLDNAQYGFESSSQGWTMAAGSGAFTTIARSTARHFAGQASLAASINATATANYILEVSPPTPAIPAGASVTFHVYIPAGTGLTSIQPYVQEGQSGGFRFTGTSVGAAAFTLDGWTTVTVTVPTNATAILRLGVRFISSGAWMDTVYVDSVSW